MPKARRPLAFISSTIGELRDVREQIQARLEPLSICDPWLFEFHAVAAGGPPSEQYLALAASCDVFIVVVARQYSEATEQEYLAAYEDHPHKIFPFFIGADEGATESFRELLTQRHSYRTVTQEDLAEAVAKALDEHVGSAHLLHRPLIADLQKSLDRQLERMQRDAKLSFLPSAGRDEEESLPLLDLLSQVPRAVISGPPGIGKTYGTTAAALALCKRDRTIPLLARLGRGADTCLKLAAQATNAIGFYPGAELLEAWAFRGRLTLIIDGWDTAPVGARRNLLTDAEQFSNQYPRARVVIMARQRMPGRLIDYSRIELRPLSMGQVDDYFSAAGMETRHRDLSTEMANVCALPLFLGAAAQISLTTTTARDCIRELIDYRLQEVCVDALDVASVRRKAGILAIELRGQRSTSRWHWQDITETDIRYVAPDQLQETIRLLESAGLVSVSHDGVTFTHELLEASSAAYTLRMFPEAIPSLAAMLAADPELTVFLAGELDDEFGGTLLRILAGSDASVLARALRFAPDRPRARSVSEVARRVFAGTQVLFPGVYSSVATGSDWMAAAICGEAESQEPSHAIIHGKSLSAWRVGLPKGSRYTVWHNASAQAMQPEWLCISMRLESIKEQVGSFRVDASEIGIRDAAERLRLTNAEGFEEAVEAALAAYGDCWEAIRLRSTLAPPIVAAAQGSARIVVGPHRLFASLAWEQPEFAIEYRELDAAGWDLSLDELLMDPADYAIRQFKASFERAIGCSLLSVSWWKPSRTPALGWRCDSLRRPGPSDNPGTPWRSAGA